MLQIEHPWINILDEMLTQMLLLWSVEMVIVGAMIGVQRSFDFCVRLGVQIGVQLVVDGVSSQLVLKLVLLLLFFWLVKMIFLVAKIASWF